VIQKNNSSKQLILNKKIKGKILDKKNNKNSRNEEFNMKGHSIDHINSNIHIRSLNNNASYENYSSVNSIQKKIQDHNDSYVY
jgi:hypothetical protein